MKPLHLAPMLLLSPLALATFVPPPDPIIPNDAHANSNNSTTTPSTTLPPSDSTHPGTPAYGPGCYEPKDPAEGTSTTCAQCPADPVACKDHANAGERLGLDLRSAVTVGLMAWVVGAAGGVAALMGRF